MLAMLIAWSAPADAGEFGASWTGDFATVASGGLERGDRHMGLVELTFDRGFKFLGRENTLHLSVQHVYGGGFSEFQVGDLQTVSNIEADDGTRLLEAWVEVPLTANSSVLIGRYDLNSEFDAIEAGGLFLSSSQGIGPDISQTGAAGPSIFPRTAFGIRLQQQHEGGGTLSVQRSTSKRHRRRIPAVSRSQAVPMLILEYEFPLRSARVKTGAWRFTQQQGRPCPIRRTATASMAAMRQSSASSERTSSPMAGSAWRTPRSRASGSTLAAVSRTRGPAAGP